MSDQGGFATRRLELWQPRGDGRSGRAGTWADERARQGTRQTYTDENHQVAKVRVADSNPVFQSIPRVEGQRGARAAGRAKTAAQHPTGPDRSRRPQPPTDRPQAAPDDTTRETGAGREERRGFGRRG
jgi:hypothetical protein